MKIDIEIDSREKSENTESINSVNARIAFIKIADQISKIQEICSLAVEKSEDKISLDVEIWLSNAIRIRNLRKKYFLRELFADPVWDILLDLAIAKSRNKKISVSSLCIAASVPTTTALRKIKDMLSDGLIFQEPDENDRRRTYISISDHAYQNMLAYIAESAEMALKDLHKKQ